MKRIMACFLALVLAFCTVGAMAAGRENKLVVGSTTALSGNFIWMCKRCCTAIIW